MGNSNSTMIAIGGGEFAEAPDILDKFLDLAKKARDPRLCVLTVATSEPEKAATKYNYLFRSRGIGHVEFIDVSQREDSFSEIYINKIKKADALFFTGGDQLNITTLLGGSPLDEAIRERVKEGIVLAGTSAGAAMMSKWMIISGKSDAAPTVGSVEIAPGMDLVDTMIVDTHFSQRGRHGRLLAAVAHFPQALGIGIDERTALVIQGHDSEVMGEGVVTIIDGSSMRHNDLPYRKEHETVGMFGVTVHVLPAGYRFDLLKNEPSAPTLKSMAGRAEE